MKFDTLFCLNRMTNEFRLKIQQNYCNFNVKHLQNDKQCCVFTHLQLFALHIIWKL